MFRRSWKTHMTRSEMQRGWVFFFLYLFLFPRLNAWAQKVLMGDGEPLVAEANVLYYALLFSLSLLAFWNFWRQDFIDLFDWLPENLAGILIGLIPGLVLRWLTGFLPLPIHDPIPQQYAAEFFAAPGPTLALILLLIPVVEELLFRGLLFGSLRNYSPLLAYLVCIPFYALCCVGNYAVNLGDLHYLLLAVRYLPMAAALTWCYDNGGSVWATVILHSAFNAALLFSF